MSGQFDDGPDVHKSSRCIASGWINRRKRGKMQLPRSLRLDAAAESLFWNRNREVILRILRSSSGFTLVVVLSVFFAGCSASSTTSSALQPSSLNSSGAATKTSPSITTASASSVLNAYQLVNNTANSRRDGRLEASVETVPQIILDRAIYNIQKVINQTSSPFSYRNPVFYIPALAANTQQWFAAEATTGSGSNTQRQLLLFVQPKPGGPWKLAAAPAATTRRALPVALTPAGAATTASPDEPGLAVAPSQLPALHASFINGSPASPGFAKGRWTSAIQGTGPFGRFYGRYGWKYKDVWAASSYPIYTLRTADGGAVVWYFLKDRQTVVRTGAGQPLQSGSVVYALTGKAQVMQRFTIDSLSEFVAIVPPRGKGKITVVAGFTGNVAATAS